MVGSALTAPERLRAYFRNVSQGPQIGGAAILQTLSDLSSACVDGASPARDAVAFSLSTIFGLHADDRSERPVTGDDNYQFIATAFDDLSRAIEFVCNDTSDEGAVAGRIVAALD